MLDKLKTTIFVKETPNGGSFYDVRKYYECDDSMHNIPNVISTDEYTPTKDDKIYFYPECNIPRFKIKQFCEKYNVSIVKYPDKANVKIAGPNTLKSFIEGLSLKEISKNDFVNYLRKYTLADVSEIVEVVNSQFVYMLYHTANKYDNLGGKLKTDYKHKVLIKRDCEEKFINLLNDTNVFDEKEILKRLNTGSVMNHEQYISIQRLFNSKDTENHKLALEMMANCDFEKSSVYLLLLMYNFGNCIYNAPNRTHVNFKSLLKFFAITEVRRIDLDDIVLRLIQRRLLSAQNLNILMPLLKEHLEDGGKSEYVKIKEIEVTEDVLTGLEDNILDEEHDTTIVEYTDEELNPHL